MTGDDVSLFQATVSEPFVSWLLAGLGVGVAIWSIAAVVLTLYLARRQEQMELNRSASGFARLLREARATFKDSDAN